VNGEVGARGSLSKKKGRPRFYDRIKGQQDTGKEKPYRGNFKDPGGKEGIQKRLMKEELGESYQWQHKSFPYQL